LRDASVEGWKQPGTAMRRFAGTSIAAPQRMLPRVEVDRRVCSVTARCLLREAPPPPCA
jgi:hypothetical protein